MINLLGSASETLRAVAGTNTVVTCTVSGLELIGTASTYKTLDQRSLPNAITTLYAPGATVQAFIKTIHLQNTSATPVTVDFYVNGTTAANRIHSINIPLSGSAIFNQEGWTVYDVNGALLFTSPTTLTGDVTGTGAGSIPTTIANDAVTFAKMQNIPTDSLMGRDTAGTGDPETILLNATLSMDGANNLQRAALTGDVTAPVGSNTTTIAPNAADNTKIADMAQATFKMRAAGAGTGDPIDGTPTQAKTALAIVSTDLSDFNEAAQDAVGNILTDSPTTNFTYNDGANTITAISGPWVNVQDNAYAAAVLPGNSAATNVTNLTALFAAAPGGSTLYFPGGTYNFNANMNIGAKTFSFLGEGNQLTGGFTILALTTGTTGLFTLTTGNWYTTFTHLTFGCITTQVSGSAVTVNDNVAVNFSNCTFAAFGGQWFNCIDYTGTAQSANTTVIDTCFFSGFKNFGVNVASDGASLVIVNTIIQGQWGTTVQTAAACVNVVNAGALQVDNCDLLGATNNMLLNPTAGKVIASVYVTNTYMDASFGSCLKISGAGATVRCRFISVSFTTSNATTALSAVEISTTVTAGAQGIDFENCSVLNTFGTTGTTNGFLITGAADFSIIACRIAGWTNGISITPFNSAGKTQPMIEDNTIGPTGGFGGNSVGILLNVGAVTYGDMIIQNNILSGNTSAPMTNNATFTTTANVLIGGNAGWTGGAGDLQALSSAGAARVNARGTVTSGVARTLLFTCRIPANSVSVGQKFLIRVTGQASAAATVTLDIASGAAGTTADTALSSIASVVAAANGYVTMEGIATVVALGAASTVAASHYQVILASIASKASVAEVINSTPTTAAWFLSICGTATAGTFTVREATITAL